MSAQPCKAPSCERPKRKSKHYCEWHWLARQSSDVQAAAAKDRLADWADVHGGRYDTMRARVSKEEWPDGERWCAGCQSFVPLFYCSGSRCRACNSMAAHEKRLEATYGIDAAEYDRIFRLQGGRCAICRNRPASIRFAVDHDHVTGQVRGILCKRCNHDLLGGAHDSVDLMWRALAYLLFPPASRTGDKVTDEMVFLALREHQRVRVAVQEAPARPDPQPAPF